MNGGGKQKAFRQKMDQERHESSGKGFTLDYFV